MNSQATRTIGNGTFQWLLEPRVGLVHARIEFTPSTAIAATSKTIAFVQTVQEAMGSGGSASTGLNEVDKFPAERDPFYGAQWNPSAGQWAGEPNSTQARPGDKQGAGQPREGSRPAGAGGPKSAVLNDSPMLKIDESKQFETAAIIVESGQLLGSLSWIIQRRKAGFFNQDSSTTIRSATVREAPTPDLQAALDSYYRGQTSVRGFAPNSEALPPGHESTLAKTLESLRAAPGRTVTLGGAATADEADPAGLSRKRAESVRSYFTGAGVDASRIQIEAHGSSWARASSSAPDAAQTNRRVEVSVAEPRQP